MKIVYSFWTKPINSVTGAEDNRFNGGWLSSKYHFLSWALSCLSAKQHYDEVELYTDDFGKHLLIDELNIPFTRVSTELNALNDYPNYCWAVGKIFTYALQETPFIHIDSDVFLGGRLPKHIENAGLLAQSLDLNPPYYKKALSQITKEFFVPEILSIQDHNFIKSSNAGIIGGSQLNVFQELYQEAIGFITKNRKAMDKLSGAALLNVVFEQLFYHNIAIREEQTIQYLFGLRQPNNREFVNFGNWPRSSQYIHLFGSDNKRIELLIDKVESLVRFNYPQLYFKILGLLNDFKFN